MEVVLAMVTGMACAVEIPTSAEPKAEAIPAWVGVDMEVRRGRAVSGVGIPGELESMGVVTVSAGVDVSIGATVCRCVKDGRAGLDSEGGGDMGGVTRLSWG